MLNTCCFVLLPVQCRRIRLLAHTWSLREPGRLQKEAVIWTGQRGNVGDLQGARCRLCRTKRGIPGIRRRVDGRRVGMEHHKLKSVGGPGAGGGLAQRTVLATDNHGGARGVPGRKS
jgi:hypothetical protein